MFNVKCGKPYGWVIILYFNHAKFATRKKPVSSEKCLKCAKLYRFRNKVMVLTTIRNFNTFGFNGRRFIWRKPNWGFSSITFNNRSETTETQAFWFIHMSQHIARGDLKESAIKRSLENNVSFQRDK